MTHKGFYFKNNKGKTVELPIAPGDFSIAVEVPLTDVTIVGKGNVKQRGVRNLREFTINAIIPVSMNDHLITAQKKLASAGAYINFFKEWELSRSKGRAVFSGYGVNMEVALDKTEFGMDETDRYWNATFYFTEWRDYEAKTMAKPARFKVGQKVKLSSKASKETNGYNLVPRRGWVGTVKKVTRLKKRYSKSDYEYRVVWGNGKNNVHIAEQDLSAVKKAVAKSGKKRSAPAKKIGRGSRVIVNGQLHADSYGGGPGLTERNAERKISLIARGRKYPYHVTTLSGGARGWVSAKAVRLK